MILHAVRSGAGPPLILLHGLFGQARNLAGLARALAGRWDVIAMDLRNHGTSPQAAGMGYQAMAGDVLETATQLNALPAAVLGHSMGGKTAMAMALLHSEAVTRLVVADIAPVAQPHANEGVLAALVALELRPGMRRGEADAALAGAVTQPAVRSFLLQNLELHPVPRWRIDLAALQAGLADVQGWPAALRGRQWNGPARFVRGGLSDYVGAIEEQAIVAAFPSAEIVTVPGAGHLLHAEAPDAFLAATGL